ncbi:putative RNA-binding Zn ribbon-like protein [Pseudonocardia sediminis]|uniref:Putative RNA-binding Zn ribbon-like protein n=1 Tax=Pseudonocardia sediminis TaxID=1397368 RepID=A0A4Q7V023_PSEST|nr:CGNR zinc finger domain-containing protein [Pseudonocardia sediminis]RZT86748.1 putative RNA-binding Zn ribbon-like protein [Pseudonocardia sediminis]
MQVPFDDYAQAAGVATELVNTAPCVWNGTDKLSDVAELETFVTTHVPASWAPGLDAAVPTDDDLAATHGLRDALRTLIDSGDAQEIVRRATELTGSVGTLSLAVDDDVTRWQAITAPEAPLADQLGLLTGVGVLGVTHALGVERFRSCASPDCAGVFIDTSRNGARRYCMPGLCGNRVNVAAHRARQRAQ